MAPSLKPATATKLSMLGGLGLGLLVLIIVFPMARAQHALRARCTRAVPGTVVAWAPADNDRRLEAVVAFDLDGQPYQAHLLELNAKRTATPAVGEQLRLKVDPTTHEAVVADPLRAWFVTAGLLLMGLAMALGSLWALLLAKPPAGPHPFDGKQLP